MWFNHTCSTRVIRASSSWRAAGRPRRNSNTAMFTANVDGSEISARSFPSGKGVSHFEWRNEAEILATFRLLLPAHKAARAVVLRWQERLPPRSARVFSSATAIAAFARRPGMDRHRRERLRETRKTRATLSTFAPRAGRARIVFPMRTRKEFMAATSAATCTRAGTATARLSASTPWSRSTGRASLHVAALG